MFSSIFLRTGKVRQEIRILKQDKLLGITPSVSHDIAADQDKNKKTTPPVISLRRRNGQNIHLLYA